MKYNYKTDYTHIFDTPAKMQQESVIAAKIMELLNKNKYDSIYDFINKNHTYQDFLKNNNLTNVVKHFGNTLNEQDFKNILSHIVKITEAKKQNDKENLKTTNIEDEQFVSYKSNDKTYFFDNTHNHLSIERQMDELQKNNKDFQTTDSKQNSSGIMNELEKSKKESLNLKYIYQIDRSKLNDEQKELFNVAIDYQLNNPEPIQIDLDRRVLVTGNSEILKIQKNGDTFSIISDGNKKEEVASQENVLQQKTFQKSLKPSTETIYS